MYIAVVLLLLLRGSVELRVSDTSGFDPTKTSLGEAVELDTLPSYSVALLAGPKEEFDRYQNDPNERAVGSKPLTRRRSK
jgi:hypothetical protein